MTRRAAALFPLLVLCALPALAQTRPTTPKPGSAERKAITEALRVPVQKALKKPVLFKIDHLKVQNGWAFLTGVPLQASGRPMDYRGTPYQNAIDNDVFDDWVCALLRREKGRWRVVRYAIGATDVAWEPWARDYKAPRALFPYPD